MELKIAFAQLVAGKNQAENKEKAISACLQAKEKGADVVLFPEMWNEGYYLPQDKDQLEALTISKDDDFVQSFRKLAYELEMAIGITFLEKHDPKPLNSVVFFDRKGE